LSSLQQQHGGTLAQSRSAPSARDNHRLTSKAELLVSAKPSRTAVSPWAIVVPLTLAQFIASYAATNMNVAINDIAHDLGTDVFGVQSAITIFTLTMAALMIPGSKLTDIWGRKRCFVIGMYIYGSGALLAAAAPSLGVLIGGYSLLEGIGSALMIPPIYILITVSFDDVTTRARFFGVVSAAAGIGAAAGPLIGGLITSSISWRASFALQVVVVGVIIYLARRIVEPAAARTKPTFDLLGTVLSAAGLFFVVFGVLQSGKYGWGRAREDFAIGGTTLIHKGGISPVWLFVAVGALILVFFFAHIRHREQAGKDPLLSVELFRNRIANLGLVTQNIQWLVLQGAFFVISVFLQTIRGYNAIETGLILTPATAGILASSAAAERLAKRYSQAILIRLGFVATMIGVGLLLLFARDTSDILTFVPGLLVIGIGVGVMLTSSVNVVQSAFPPKDQGEISGLSRSVSNLGSALGTAVVGSVLVSSLVKGNAHFVLAMVVLLGLAAVGLGAALLIPRETGQPASEG
jgi:MFS family permease